MRHWLALTVLLLGTPFAAAFANDWGTFAIISDTLGNHAGRLCVGEGLRVSDIGCPTYAPSVTTAGDVSVTGNLSANKFIGDGSLLTGIGQGDRITSGTLAVVANSETSYVSLSTAATTWGYFSSGASYLPHLAATRVSSTNISTTLLQFATSAVTCTNGISGSIRWSAPSGTIQVCDGAGWVSLASGTTGGAGVSALASLTDVQFSNPAGRDHLRYDALSSKWVNISESTVMSTTTMVNGWPDAIRCSHGPTSGEVVTLYHYAGNAGGGTVMYKAPYATNYMNTYTSAGSYSLGPEMYNGGVANCVGKSIAQLYASGQAFNFIGNSGAGSSALGDRITSGTLAVVANSETSYVSLSTAATTWGYFSSGASYLPHLAATRVSSTNISATHLQLSSPSTVLACGAGLEGAMRYTSGTMQFCNGTSWTTLGSAGAATAASSTGAIQFNVANALAGDTANLFWDDANNRLGVGTADPSSSFEVYGNTNALVRSFVSNPNTGNAAFAEVAARNSTGANDSMRLLAMSSGYASSGPFIADSGVLSADTGLSGGLTLVTRASGAPIRFFTSTSEHMRLSGDGNFGIGTATPTTTLQVSGSFTVSTSTQTTTPSLYVGADGKVGIGTSTPSSTLMVEGGQPGASAGYSQLFINTPNNNQGSALAMRTTNTGTERVWAIMAGTGGGSPNHNLRFYDVTAPAERMTLTTSGNLGIAKAAPLARLDVSGTISASDAIQVGSSGLTCGAGIPGAIRYNSGNLQYCNETNWTTLGASGGGQGDRIVSGSTSIIAYQDKSLTFITNGTGRMIVDELGNVSFGISNTFATQRYYFYDDQTNKSAYRTVNISPWFKHSTNGTYYNIGMLMSPAVEVGSGISNPGYVYGQWTSLLRRDAPDAGSLDSIVGNVLNVGHYTATGSTRHTSVTTGLMIGMYAQNGTMATMYGLRIISRTGTNVTTSYGISQEGAHDRNYFAGNTGVGQGKTSALANLDVAGTISLTGALHLGQNTIACATGVSGSIRYNTTSNTVQFCNGMGWTSLSSGTTAGVSAMASLTDVALTNLAGRDYLRYDSVSGKWVNISESTAMSTTTMVNGWPDAIQCSNGTNTWILPLSQPNHSGGYTYYQVMGAAPYIAYNTGTKAYATHSGMSGYDCVSNTWSISQLYAQGKAFNFIGNAATGGDALGDRITSGTVSVTVNADGFISLTTGVTDWGYLSSGNSYLPTLVSGRVSATNISATYVQLASATSAVGCDANTLGTTRRNGTTGLLEICQ